MRLMSGPPINTDLDIVYEYWLPLTYIHGSAEFLYVLMSSIVHEWTVSCDKIGIALIV